MKLKIKPRTPGLWMCPARGVEVSDSAEVDKAQAHLLQLIEDPYYFEAFHRIKQAIPRARAPIDKGSLAARHQNVSALKKTGRPPIRREWADKLLDALDRTNGELTISLCRKMVKQRFPHAIKYKQEQVAKEFLQIIKNQNKKRVKTTR